MQDSVRLFLACGSAVLLAACAPPEPAPEPVRAVRTVTVAAESAGGRREFAAEVRARTEWLRQLGFQQSRMVEVQGVAFVARSAAVDYLKPARLDDLLEIDTRVASVGRAQVVFDQRVLRGAEILAQGLMRIACVNPARDGRACALPSDLLALFRQLAPETAEM